MNTKNLHAVRRCLTLGLAAVFADVFGAATETAVGDVRLRGYVGDRLDACIRENVAATDVKYLTDWFAWQQEVEWWHAEFWGKWMHAAAPLSVYTRDTTLRKKVETSVRAIHAAQLPDGYIGNYLSTVRKGGCWDIWGCKYTLLGLLHHDALAPDGASLAVAGRLADYLIARLTKGPTPLHKLGAYRGLPACSLLEPIVWLYRRTGEKRYLDFAALIVREMNAPAADDGAELIDAALRGVDVANRPTGEPEWKKGGLKAYEMMSCYQGLTDYFDVTGERRCLDAAVATARSIAHTEVNLAGGACTCEHWYGGAANQTRPYRRTMETCVLTTWMRLCEKLLVETEDPFWADQLERTFYNAYLASLSKDGRTFSMYHPISGVRHEGEPHCRTLTNCCNANGPRGFLALMKTLLTASGDKVAFNHYVSSTASIRLPKSNAAVVFETFSRYPQEDEAFIRYRGEKPLAFTLRLRIPAWSSNTVVRVQPRDWGDVWSRKSIPLAGTPVAGSYFDITRIWQPGDRIDLRFDLTVRAHVCNDHVAFTRGPVLLARDLRFGDGDLGEPFRRPFELSAFTRLDATNPDMWIEADAAFKSSTHFDNPEFHPRFKRIHFCDYASAGNTWTAESAYRTWFPLECLPNYMTAAPVASDPPGTDFVDPFIGTTATGHTTPAAAYPFGMVQAGPITGTLDWRYCSGYRFEDATVTGYALTALSGTGFCEYNELLVLPFSGNFASEPPPRAIDKKTERAAPGFYAVRQSDDGVSVEIAAAKRAAIYRFRWQPGHAAKVFVNLPYGNGQRDGNQIAGSHDGRVTRLADGRIEGEHFRTGCIMRRKIAFALEFSRPWISCVELPKRNPDELPRYVLSFDLPTGGDLLLKSAFSLTSPEAARRNLLASVPAWDFDGTKAAARASWNDLFARSTCEGTPDEKRNWYTALYHLYFQPNDYSDTDDKAPYYTTLSLWDTFRAAQPWYTLAAPEITRGVVASLMAHKRKFGRLPVMSYGGMNFDCMIGNHAVPVIVDAYLKGLWPETISANEVCDAICVTLLKPHTGKPKEDWPVYDRYGYYPFDAVNGEGVSRTMECAYDDWCAAQMAKALGRTSDAARFTRRSGFWRNVFDAASGFARGKSTAGAWREPFDPFAFGHGAGRDNDFTEGNAFQYSWHVLHDVDGLITAMGGRDKALARLQSLFRANDRTSGAPPDVTGLIGQYVHGNEPSHHVIYLFTLLGRPDLTVKYVREVFDRFYRPRPDGLCGNDDCGQMSAWYLFSAMGFYPLNPCGGEYVLGAPQVPRVTLRLEGGKTFTVRAIGLSKVNIRVKSVTLNGLPIIDGKLRHADIVRGGELVFEFGQ